MRLRHASLVLMGALALLTACREAKVTNYRVPKEPPPAPPPGMTTGADMASTAVPTAQGDGLEWSAPANWEAKPVSAMRRGSYAIHGADGAVADLSITAFPGDVGGDLANVNRWREQIHLPPLGAAELPAALSTVTGDGLNLTLVEMANPDSTPAQRILGALVSYEGNTWFFKLMGPDALVAARKPEFLAFLKTVKGHTH